MSRITCSQVETHQRKQSNVTATANIPLGYKVHQQPPSGCQEYPSQHSCGDIRMLEFNQRAKIFNTLKPTGIYNISGRKLDKLNNKRLLTKGRQLGKFLRNIESRDKTDKIILINRIQECVKRGMTAYEEDINIRREKLRAMIQAEEAELTQELVNQAHRCQASRDRELSKDIDEQRIREEERQRMLVAALKRRQQLLERCPEVRDKISREMTRGVKYSNLAQILEKSSRLREERQLDTLWHEITLRNSEIQRGREEEDRRKRRAIDKDTSRILEQQIARRLYFREETCREREQERQEHEHLRAQVRAEEEHNLTQKQTKREQLKRDLEEQLMLARRRLAESARQESETAQKLKVESDVQLKKEKEQIAKSAESFKREMTAYMKSLAELRAQEVKRDAEAGAIIEQSAKDAQARRDFAIKKDKEKKENIFQEFIAERNNQLKAKREIEQEQERRLKEEQKINKKNAELDTAACLAETKSKRKKALQYGLELQAQLENQRLTKYKNLKENTEKYQHTVQEEEEKYQELTQELLEASKIITPNAFKTMQNTILANP